MTEWVKRNWNRLNADLRDSPERKFLSPIIFNQYVTTLPLIKEYAQGDLIDLGCGYMPFRPYVRDQVSAYEGIDVFSYSDDITYIGDIQEMSFIDNEKYDTALCLEVLEHISDVMKALDEIHRILKPNAILILSVPHLSRIHDAPNDYYRFTEFGISKLLERSGFHLIRLTKTGGLFSFIGHQMSTLVLSAFHDLPILNSIIFNLNGVLITRFCYWLDLVLDRNGIFASGYSVVCLKT